MARPSDKEIQSEVNKARDIEYDDDNQGCFGMTYEQGVSAALDWVLGDTDEKPIES